MMDYEDLGKKISKEFINYPVKDESLMEVYNILAKKYNITNADDKSKVLAKVTHYITIAGYDIDCIKPLKFKYFL